jgi:hypothetical protein
MSYTVDLATSSGQVILVFETVVETGRKLNVLGTLYDEDDVIIIAFQEFVLAIKELLSVAELISHHENSESAKLDFNRAAQVLTSAIKTVSSEIRHLCEAIKCGNDVASSTFEESISTSLEAAARLKTLTIEASKRDLLIQLYPLSKP